MTDPTARACTQCGNLQIDGDFCERCGAQLPPTVGDSGFAPPSIVPIPPHSVPTAPVASSAAEPSVGESTQPSAPVSGPEAAPPVGAASTEPTPLSEPAPPTAAASEAQTPPPLPSQPPTHQGGGYSPPPPPPPGTRGSTFFESLFDLSFKEFVTPRIIRWLFVLSLVVVGVGVLMMIVTGFALGVVTGLFTLLILAPLTALFYVLIARLALEVVVVLFKIEEHLAEMGKQE